MRKPLHAVDPFGFEIGFQDAALKPTIGCPIAAELNAPGCSEALVEVYEVF
jgi:hypothetical protein